MLYGFGNYDESAVGLFDVSGLTKGLETVTKGVQQGVQVATTVASTAQQVVKQGEQIGKQAVSQAQGIAQQGKQMGAQFTQMVPKGIAPVAQMASKAPPIAKMAPMAAPKAAKKPAMKTRSGSKPAAKPAAKPAEAPATPQSDVSTANVAGSEKKSNKMLYVGIGVGVLVLGGAAFFLLGKKKTATQNRARSRRKGKRK